MNLDDLKREWQATNEGAATLEERDRLIAVTCRRVEQFWGQIVRRDLIEAVVALFLIFVFGRMVFTLDDLISRFGAGFLVLCCLFIVWKLHRARTIERPAPIDAAVRDFCRIELGRLDHQIALLKSILWWYIAPIMIGVNLVFVGTNGLGNESLFYVLATILLGWFIQMLNQLAVTAGLEPLHEEIACVLGQLEGGGLAGARATTGPTRSPPPDDSRHRSYDAKP